VVTSASFKAGIYTSYNNWRSITGDSSQFSQYPLWYSFYDGSPIPADYCQIGGWAKPAMFMKQFVRNAPFMINACNIAADFSSRWTCT
jgi:hypothetical protein